MIKDWIEAVRPRTLPVSLAGVLTAVGFAKMYGVLKPVPALLCFTFALLAQIVSNFANEYYDFKRGADKKGRVGPRRGVTEGTISPRAMLIATYSLLAVDCAVGLCLIPYGGWEMLIVGVFIAIFALAYSAGPYPLSCHGWGDVAVLVFFGIIPVNFTFYVMNCEFSLIVFLASVAIGLMSVNVLIINNYRDIEDDKDAGKFTTAILLGRKYTATWYLCNGYIAVSILSPLWFYYPAMALCAAVYLLLHNRTWIAMQQSEGAALNPVLGATARNMLVFAILLFVATIIV